MNNVATYCIISPNIIQLFEIFVEESVAGAGEGAGDGGWRYDNIWFNNQHFGSFAFSLIEGVCEEEVVIIGRAECTNHPNLVANVDISLTGPCATEF